MKKLLTLMSCLTLAALSLPAVAAPIIVAVPAATDANDPFGFGAATGAGLTAYDIYVETPTPDAYGVSITFTGAIAQLQGKPTTKALLQNIDNDTNAANADGRAGTSYLAANDSFFFNSSSDSFSSQFGTISQTATSYSNTGIGTTPGQLFTSALLARVVASGPIGYSADVGLGSTGRDVLLSGTISVPEPATWMLIGLGTIGLFPLVRKRIRKSDANH